MTDDEFNDAAAERLTNDDFSDGRLEAPFTSRETEDVTWVSPQTQDYLFMSISRPLGANLSKDSKISTRNVDAPTIAKQGIKYRWENEQPHRERVTRE